MPERLTRSVRTSLYINAIVSLNQRVTTLALAPVSPIGYSLVCSNQPSYLHRRPSVNLLRRGHGPLTCSPPLVLHLRGGAFGAFPSDDDRSCGVDVIKAVQQPYEGRESSTELDQKTGQYPGASKHDRQIAALALPALLSLLVDPVLSIVDTAYVGRGLGAISLAALGPCTSIFHFSFNTFRSLTLSTTTMVSSSLAAGNRDKAGQIVQQMYLISLVLGTALQATLLTQAPSMLAIMGAGPSTDLFPIACSYLKVRALAAPAVLLIMVSEGVFRGHSNTKAPAVAALSAAAANVILDPILMFALSMGISGAAAATVFAQYLAAFLYGIMLWRGCRGGVMEIPFVSSRLTRKPCKAEASELVETVEGVNAWKLLVSVVSANVAMLIRTTSLMACWAVATAVATRMSSASVGAHQVALSLWLLLALVAEAPSIAAQVLGSRYIGRGQLTTARSMARRVIVLTLGSSVTLGTILFFLSRFIPRGFTSDPDVLQRLGKLLPLLAVQQPLVAVTLAMEGLLVGAGQFRWLGATTACSSALTALAIILIGRQRPHWDVVGIWGGITAMLIMRLVTAAWRLLDRKQGPYWEKKQGSRRKKGRVAGERSG